MISLILYLRVICHSLGPRLNTCMSVRDEVKDRELENSESTPKEDPVVVQVTDECGEYNVDFHK